MDTQLMLVIAIVAVATIYLAKSLFMKSKSHACDSGKCSCSNVSDATRNP